MPEPNSGEEVVALANAVEVAVATKDGWGHRQSRDEDQGRDILRTGHEGQEPDLEIVFAT